MRKFKIVAMLVLVLALCAGMAYSEQETSETDNRVQFWIYLFDQCGGCGVDSPGCGNCKNMDRIHAEIKNQFGNRLYDGTMRYIMRNCRTEAYDREYDVLYTTFNIPEELYGVMPAVFISRDGVYGVFLLGEECIPYAQEYFDKYLACETDEDIEALRQEALDLYYEKYPDYKQDSRKQAERSANSFGCSFILDTQIGGTLPCSTKPPHRGMCSISLLCAGEF